MEYFFIKLIGFMLKGKSLLDYTNLLSPCQYEKKKKKKQWNNNETLTIKWLTISSISLFQKRWRRKKYIALNTIIVKNLKPWSIICF